MANAMGNEADGFNEALARARSGDEAGFLQLWRELHPRLLRYLRVLSRDDADDAARARVRVRDRLTAADVDSVADDHLVENQVLDYLSTRHAVTLVAELSRDQAEAVVLRIIAGLDTAAVACLLGKSPGAVRVALHRGLRALAADPRLRALEEADR